jgi:hypothetical protein
MTVHRPTLPTDPQTACKILLDCYEDAAGSEALLRAFLAARDFDRAKAQFWIEVYGLVAERDGNRARQPKAKSKAAS